MQRAGNEGVVSYCRWKYVHESNILVMCMSFFPRRCCILQIILGKQLMQDELVDNYPHIKHFNNCMDVYMAPHMHGYTMHSLHFKVQ